MLRSLAQQAYEIVSEDAKLVRLTTLMTIVHSLVFVVYVIYQVSQIAATLDADRSITSYALTFINSISINPWTIGLWLITAVWYYLLPAVGQWVIISYLIHKKWWMSVMGWFQNFFPLFQFEWSIWAFQLLLFLVVCSRVWMSGIADQVVVIISLIVRFVLIICVQVGTAYVRFLIVKDKIDLKSAVYKSITLAMHNLRTTFRGVLLWFLLTIRFIINGVILILIPIAILRIWNYAWFGDYITNTALSVVVGILILLTAYINGMVEAFFITYRYCIYNEIIEKNIS